MLISINVHESTGHLLSCNLHFLVRVNDTVRTVIQTALRTHARHGRLPSLRKNSDDFFLYRANSDFIALSPVVPIGRTGGWKFLLYKKKQEEYYFGEHYKQQGRGGGMINRHATNWKQWINKSLSFNLLSH
ncbi:hypothetical protein AMTR_s00364p00012660 [Amborella trichopoda]|uniref:DUF7054 domain-containing protein n=1 Tax=Amborella trichopoda TaxID=13333 RepID=W1NPT0_AMBTC|nr:hypothetical protein AMTR_s00364p00012660 [Amborella trichopoda]